MADNIAITEGSGRTIATDEVGGANYQYVKLAFGVDGTATLNSTTNPLPIALTNLERAEDSAHSTGHSGIMALGVVTTSGTPTTVTDGDYVALSQNAVGGLRVTPVPDTVGGLSFYKNISVLATPLAVKASAGQIYGMIVSNQSASKAYLKLFNVASGSVTAGTTVPDITIGLPAAGITVMDFPHGIAFSTAISMIATTTIADSGLTAMAANDVSITVLYK